MQWVLLNRHPKVKCSALSLRYRYSCKLSYPCLKCLVSSLSAQYFFADVVELEPTIVQRPAVELEPVVVLEHVIMLGPIVVLHQQKATGRYDRCTVITLKSIQQKRTYLYAPDDSLNG
jgi:hypothetical protein